MTEARVRRVAESEWRALRDLRLRALADAPDAFGSTLEREAAFADEKWQEWAREAASGNAETCFLGAPAIRLDVADGNVEARRFYEGLGFTPTGRTRQYEDRPHLETIELERRLQ